MPYNCNIRTLLMIIRLIFGICHKLQKVFEKEKLKIFSIHNLRINHNFLQFYMFQINN
jgi:hypothetical protein